MTVFRLSILSNIYELFNIRGPKPDKVDKHQRISVYQDKLNAFDEMSINDFNLGLGRIYRWF